MKKLIKKPCVFIRVLHMNPNIFWVTGPGFLNQVPTLTLKSQRVLSPNAIVRRQSGWAQNSWCRVVGLSRDSEVAQQGDNLELRPNNGLGLTVLLSRGVAVWGSRGLQN